MSRGIYILGNDRVIDDAIALLNSIRLHDPDTPIVLIPYDEQYQKIAEISGEKFGVQVYPDLELVDRISHRLHDTFGTKFFARPNTFRKEACWYGLFDQFLYLDTDIVVFEKIIDTLDYLIDYDFVSCDYQYKGGLKNVFTPQIFQDSIFSETKVKSVFNSGFWASKKNLFSEERLYEIFRECAEHPEYFDFSEKTSDQPIINYIALKATPNYLNLAQYLENEPGNWGGSAHFEVRIESEAPVLYDKGKRLRYVHWAGIKMQPGAPYYDVWEYYRYYGETPPPRSSQALPAPKNPWSQLRQTAQRWLKQS
ncbi:MAG: Npun_R2821/Npun_R2822 family protein [Prochlorotrichaceae cyanobacterium]